MAKHYFAKQMFQARRRQMKIYQIEQLIVERNHTWEKLQKYVKSEAVNFQGHEIEQSIFKMLLEIGKNLLQEVFVQFDTNKSEKSMLSKTGERFFRHKVSSDIRK